MSDLHDLPGPFTYHLTRQANGSVEITVSSKEGPVSVLTLTRNAARYLARDIWELTD